MRKAQLKIQEEICSESCTILFGNWLGGTSHKGKKGCKRHSYVNWATKVAPKKVKNGHEKMVVSSRFVNLLSHLIVGWCVCVCACACVCGVVIVCVLRRQYIDSKTKQTTCNRGGRYVQRLKHVLICPFAARNNTVTVLVNHHWALAPNWRRDTPGTL